MAFRTHARRVMLPTFVDNNRFSLEDISQNYGIRNWFDDFFEIAQEGFMQGSYSQYEILIYLFSGLYEMRFYLVSRIRCQTSEQTFSLQTLLTQPISYYKTLFLQPLADILDRMGARADVERQILKTISAVTMIEKEKCVNEYKFLKFIEGNPVEKLELMKMTEFPIFMTYPYKGPCLPQEIIDRFFEVAKILGLNSFEATVLLIGMIPEGRPYLLGQINADRLARGIPLQQLFMSNLKVTKVAYFSVVSKALQNRILEKEVQWYRGMHCPLTYPYGSNHVSNM